MAGGMIWTVDDVPIRTPDGGLLTCPCGNQTFDVTLRGGELDRLACAAFDCQAIITAENYAHFEAAGR